MNHYFSHNKLQLDSAGTLFNKVNNLQVETLSLSGQINGTDFESIRSFRELKLLDLTDCMIVGGGNVCELIDNRVKVKCKAHKNELSDYMLCRLDGRKSYRIVLLPQGILRIGKMALAGQNNLESITIPVSVKKIDNDAFGCCSSLKSVILNEGLKIICNGAFWGLNNLTELEIPSTVKKIGKRAFSSSPIKTLRVYNPVPPKLIIDTIKFPGLKYLSSSKQQKNIKTKYTSLPFRTKDCNLIVPKGSILRYQKSKGWNQFENIKEETRL